MKSIAIIYGTRPEAIKLAPLILALRAHPKLDVRVCVTGQHRELLEQAHAAFGITPDVDLNLMRRAQSLASFAGLAMQKLDAYLDATHPDLVLVHGDTATSWCGALAAFYRQIPIGHVEAGLRSGSLQSPWPEEAHRLLIARLATLNFAASEAARRNLLSEGIDPQRIILTGNTVTDALRMTREKVAADPTLGPLPPGLELHSASPIVVVTSHRREAYGDKTRSICDAVSQLAQAHPDARFVLPLHPNPMVETPIRSYFAAAHVANVQLLPPLGYASFVALLSRAALVLTDSGGVQEEATALGLPVLILRDSTERPLDSGPTVVRLVGTTSNGIVAAAHDILRSDLSRKAAPPSPTPGDERPTGRIIAACTEFLMVKSSAAVA